MHFVIHVFSNHVEALHSVTPIDLPAQSAVLSDEVVVEVLHSVTPIDSGILTVSNEHNMGLLKKYLH